MCVKAQKPEFLLGMTHPQNVHLVHIGLKWPQAMKLHQGDYDVTQIVKVRRPLCTLLEVDFIIRC